MPSQSPSSSPGARPDRPRPRILLVDDDPNVLAALAAHLRRRYAVDIASEGREAVQRLDSPQPYEVVITDMRMPVMNGVDVLREAFERSPDTVRILLTGYADLEIAARAVNEGQVFRLLTKPCPPPMIARALHDALVHRRARRARQSRLARALREVERGAALADTLADRLSSTSHALLEPSHDSPDPNTLARQLAAYAELLRQIGAADHLDARRELSPWINDLVDDLRPHTHAPQPPHDLDDETF